MQLNNYIQTKFPFFVALSLTFLLASCGSYQYVGYDSDGIYSEDEVVYEDSRTVPVETNNQYKDYFDEKSNQYSNIPNDGSAIFTDIDSYEGNYNEEASDEVPTGNAGWGQESDQVVINIYDNGWNNWAWGPNWGWNNWGWNNWARYNSRWGGGFGWGYNAWGWNNWGWNAGWGWNAYNPGWGWGFNTWCPPGYYYGNSYNGYRNRSLAFNSGRRGSNSAYLNRASSRRSTIGNTSALSRSNTRIRSNSINNRSNTRIRTTRPGNSTISRGNTRTTRSVRGNTRTTRSNNSTIRNSNTRSTRVRTNSGSASRTRVSTPSRSSSRSSVRSSGGSSRSSGSSSRSSSRGGRGGRG